MSILVAPPKRVRYLIVMATNKETKMATVEQIFSAVGGKVSRDGQSVVVGYGNDGYARLTPDYVIVDGQHLPAAEIKMACRTRKGGRAAELRERLAAAGIRAC
jgi:hypothetical protein